MAVSNVKIKVTEGSLDVGTGELVIFPEIGKINQGKLVIRKGGIYWYDTPDTTKRRVELDWKKFKLLMMKQTYVDVKNKKI